MICETFTGPRPKAVWGGRAQKAAAAVLTAAALTMTGCSDAVRSGQASSYLVLTTLQGGPGEAGALGSTLASDVLNVDATTGVQTIFGDRGDAAFELQMKDPVGTSPSPVNSITITQYHVEYVRTDGRNTPGVDVPFPFDGGVTLTVS